MNNYGSSFTITHSSQAMRTELPLTSAGHDEQASDAMPWAWISACKMDREMLTTSLASKSSEGPDRLQASAGDPASEHARLRQDWVVPTAHLPEVNGCTKAWELT